MQMYHITTDHNNFSVYFYMNILQVNNLTERDMWATYWIGKI